MFVLEFEICEIPLCFLRMHRKRDNDPQDLILQYILYSSKGKTRIKHSFIWFIIPKTKCFFGSSMSLLKKLQKLKNYKIVPPQYATKSCFWLSVKKPSGVQKSKSYSKYMNFSVKKYFKRLSYFFCFLHSAVLKFSIKTSTFSFLWSSPFKLI